MTTTVSYRPSSPGSADSSNGDPILVARYQEIARADDLCWADALPQAPPAGQRRPGGRLPRPPARRRRLRPARGPQGLLARVLPRRRLLTTRTWPASARVAARVARIQHDNVVDVHDFVDQGGIRVMEMEWLDGYDLREVLSPRHAGAQPRAAGPGALAVRQPRHPGRRARCSRG